MEKQVIKINYRRAYAVWFIVAIGMCLLAFSMAAVCIVTLLDEEPLSEILSAFFLEAILVGCLIYTLTKALMMMQYAELSEEGIVIYSKVHTVVTLSWSDVKEIAVKTLRTRIADGRRGVKLSWLVLYTDKKPTWPDKKRKYRQRYSYYSTEPLEKNPGINKKSNDVCWYIRSVKENLEVIRRFVERYALTGKYDHDEDLMFWMYFKR